MDAELVALLEALHREGREFDAGQPDRLSRRRNLEPETAALLALLVEALAPQHLLELGTSNGYSTIWLADAARRIGASLVSVEIERQRVEQARANLVRAGLSDQVQLRCADAAEVLAQSQDAQWQFVFLDAERPAYVGYWPQLMRVLAPGGLLVVDNVISHADELQGFRALVSGQDGVREALAPTGAGALLVLRS